MKRILLLALCAFFAGTAGARTLYVNAAMKNNKGNGLSVTKAKKTIQAAVNKAKRGDTILVYPGSYEPIQTKNKRITIKAVKSAKKTKIVCPKSVGGRTFALAELGKPYKALGGSSSGIWTRGRSSILQGFTLDGSCKAFRIPAEQIGVSGGKVKSCIIQKVGQSFGTSASGFLSFSTASVAVNASLYDCTLKDNSGNLCPRATTSAGTNLKEASFTRCAITGNHSRNGIYDASLVNCLVADNTVQDTLLDNCGLLNCTVTYNTVNGPNWDPALASDSKFRNCILRNNYLVPAREIDVLLWWYYDQEDEIGQHYLGVRRDDETTFSINVYDRDNPDEVIGTVEVTENTIGDYYPGWWKTEGHTTDYAPGTNKQIFNARKDKNNTYSMTDRANTNPKFASVSKKNYRLLKSSPFIDKGSLTKSEKKKVGTKDLGGRARIRGKAIDRGCYER